jgi:hypothetical protein
MGAVRRSQTDPESLAELREDCAAMDPRALGAPRTIRLPEQRETDAEIYDVYDYEVYEYL